ncbi:hypothetical protein [Prosthecobacter sp.]|uniref:hypothetical protein n=1 Tax=Prosthecobacter sp. TaxID=1965333 RepID=UPI002ABB689A|nr:hypothetical protein [Prosthecobacter sp.]MDZ4401946.1 hypothetical protein [Prosthecobacter sp.]
MLTLLLIAGCALPDAAFQNYTAANKASQWNSVLEALGGSSVRRAQSSDNRPLYNGAASMNVPTQSESINDIARLFAGMDASFGQNVASSVRNSSAWTAHKQRMDNLWATHLSLHREPLRAWANGEIGDVQGANALFYPFSGPDFLFASVICPSAETYVMCGLEPAEPLPRLGDLSQGEIDRGLYGLHNSVSTIMQNSYFITTDMRNDLQATRFRGVLPVIMAFMARTGYTVESVDTVRLDGAGNVTLSGSSGNTGLMIRCRSGLGGLKRVFYFKQDLSNGGVSSGGPFLTFVSRLGRVPAFTKSASYLMHEGGFSSIRDFLLRHSSAIVQDPSGVPYREFVRHGWDVWLYGNYRSTLDIFSGCQQPDLVSAYSSGRHAVKPLNFGIGYLMNPQTTSLMVGRPRR